MSTGIARSSAVPIARETDPEGGAQRPPWRAVLTAAACFTYPFLVYGVIAHRQPWLGLLLTLTALLGISAQLPRRLWAVAGVLGAVALAALLLPIAATPALLFLPPLLVNFGLAWFFGRTLASGRVALITRFAKMQYADPSPEILAYTRRLTVVWTVFFLAMAAVSGGLAAFGAYAAWVWFTAVGNYLCVAALFAVEYAWRRHRFPRQVHVAPLQQVMMMRAALRDRGR